MNKILVSVYDAKAEAFGSPVAVAGLGTAIRSFSDAVKDSKTDFFKHPEDYTLFRLGEFDERVGALIPNTAPVRVISALECLDAEDD